MKVIIGGVSLLNAFGIQCIVRSQASSDPDREPVETPMLHDPLEPLQFPPTAPVRAEHQPAPVAVHAINRQRRLSRPRRTASYPADQQLVSRVGRRESLYNWLFDRPAHRRVARSIGQNTGNLVRRLSQSRLFLNLAGMQTQQQQQPQQSDALEIPAPVPHYVNMPEVADAEVAWQMARTVATDRGSAEPRPETPPPMYQDVMK